jgi:predicted DNA-binding ribbon-helix-helix protein
MAYGDDPADLPYLAARKYSVTIAGHETSLRLEPAFWAMLVAGAARRSIPVNALIARIDAARIDSGRVAGGSDSAAVPNLASAIRQWALVEAQAGDAPGTADKEKGRR